MIKNKVLGISATLASLLAVALGSAGCTQKGISADKVDLSVDPTGASILFWHPFGAKVSEPLEELIEEFEQETGITVTVEAREGYDNLKKAVTLAAPGKKYPNVTLGYPDHFFEYVDSDIIVRMDHYLEDDDKMVPVGEDEKLYPVSADDFYADYMEEVQSIEIKDDGTGYTLGLPFNKSTEVMSYNKTFFDYAQTIDETIVIPETWQELETIGAKIKTLVYGMVDANELVIARHTETNEFKRYDSASHIEQGYRLYLDMTGVTKDNFRPLGYDSLANFFITELKNFGSSYTAYDPVTRKGYLDFNETNTKQKTKDMMQYFRDLYEANLLGVPATWEESKYCSNPFKDMKLVMTIGSTGGVTNSVPDGNKFSVGSAHVPYNGNQANARNVISQGTNLCMLDKGTEKQRVASWLFVKYLAKYANGAFCAQTGYFPSCEYAKNSDEYQEMLNNTGGMPGERLVRDTALVDSNVYMNENEHWIKYVDSPFNGSASIREDVVTIFRETLIKKDGQYKDLQTILDDFYKTHQSWVRS